MNELTNFGGQWLPRSEVYVLASERMRAAGIREAEVEVFANWFAYGGAPREAPEEGK